MMVFGIVPSYNVALEVLVYKTSNIGGSYS
jgi:hypothetical protein